LKQLDAALSGSEASTSRVMGLLEPLLVLAMGLMVGLVVVAVLLPIFELNQLIK